MFASKRNEIGNEVRMHKKLTKCDNSRDVHSFRSLASEKDKLYFQHDDKEI